MTIARFLPRFRQARRRLAEIETREAWSVAQMQAFQLQQLNELWSHAAQNVPYYRELASTHRLPPCFDSFEHFQATMPLLRKDALRQRPDDFLAPAAAPGRWRKTSGSTGVPMRFFATHETHHRQLCYQYRFRQHWGLDIFDRAAFFGAGTSQTRRGTGAAIARAREDLTDRLRNRIRLPVHQMGRDDLARQLDRMQRFRPTYLYGYSRAIYLLALQAAAIGFRSESLRVVMMTAEPAFPHMVAAVEKAFGVPAVIEYGSTECGVTAYEWPDRKLRVRADRVLLETLPRADGQFDITKTILDNFDFPLLRYQIEDLTSRPMLQTEAFPVLHNVAGRNDDLVYTASGTAVHPAELDALFESSLATIRRYRIHQNARGDVHVQVEPVDRAAADLIMLRQILSQTVPGQDVMIELATVGSPGTELEFAL